MHIATDALRFLADRSAQERIWVDGDEEFQFTSPTETMCVLFDDSALDWYLKSGQTYFDKEIDRELEQLSMLVDETDFDKETIEMFKSDEWQKIIGKATSIWEKLQSRFGELKDTD